MVITTPKKGAGRHVIDGSSFQVSLELQKETPDIQQVERILAPLREARNTQSNYGIPDAILPHVHASPSSLYRAVVRYLQAQLVDPEGSTVGLTLVRQDNPTPLYSGVGTTAISLEQSVSEAAGSFTANTLLLQGGFALHLDRSLDTLSPTQRSVLIKQLPGLEKALLTCYETNEAAQVLLQEAAEKEPAATSGQITPAPAVAIGTEGDLVTITRKEYAALQSQATTDSLTSLANRTGYVTRLEQSFADRARELATPYSVLMLDIDKFKDANDAYGHLKGDEVLVAVAEVIRSCIREKDIAARFGGEEFVITLPDTPADIAAMVAERLRKSIQENIAIDVKKEKHYHPTVSIGVATSIADKRVDLESVAVLQRDADAALYQAKNAGRNQVKVYVPPVAPEIGTLLELGLRQK